MPPTNMQERPITSEHSLINCNEIAHDVMLSVAEAAKLCGITEWTIRKWLKAGKLDGVRVGAWIIRIPKSQLKRVISKIEPEAPSANAGQRVDSAQLPLPRRLVIDKFCSIRSDETFVDRLLSIREAAELCAISHWTIRRWVKSGSLDIVRVGPRIIRLHESQLFRVLSKVNKKPTTA